MGSRGVGNEGVVIFDGRDGSNVFRGFVSAGTWTRVLLPKLYKQTKVEEVVTSLLVVISSS